MPSAVSGGLPPQQLQALVRHEAAEPQPLACEAEELKQQVGGEVQRRPNCCRAPAAGCFDAVMPKKAVLHSAHELPTAHCVRGTARTRRFRACKAQSTLAAYMRPTPPCTRLLPPGARCSTPRPAPPGLRSGVGATRRRRQGARAAARHVMIGYCVACHRLVSSAFDQATSGVKTT